MGTVVEFGESSPMNRRNPLAQDARRIAADNRIAWNILHDNRACGNNTVVADLNARHYDASGANLTKFPDISVNMHSSDVIMRENAGAKRYGRALSNMNAFWVRPVQFRAYGYQRHGVDIHFPELTQINPSQLDNDSSDIIPDDDGNSLMAHANDPARQNGGFEEPRAFDHFVVI